jgi:hypothetical protein
MGKRAGTIRFSSDAEPVGGTMASGDWIALGAAIAAIVASVVAIIAYRLQRRSQAMSDENQLNELIEKIQGGLGNLDKLSSAITIEDFAASGVALTGLRGQALEAKKLIKRADIKPDWFQNMILGYAFTQAWDPKAAFTYWDDAVSATSGGDAHQAHVSSLEARANFYYTRGLKDDWKNAHKDFNEARDELLKDPEGQGRDLALEQIALMFLRQASLELKAEGETAAAALAANAFLKANSIGTQWRKRHALKVIGKLMLELQQKEGVPGLLGKVAAELSQPGGVGLDKFPADTAELLSLPPDGSLSLPPDGSLSLPPDGSLSLPPDGSLSLPPDGSLFASTDLPARRDGEEQ